MGRGRGKHADPAPKKRRVEPRSARDSDEDTRKNMTLPMSFEPLPGDTSTGPTTASAEHFRQAG
jgi:hypothetical protein